MKASRFIAYCHRDGFIYFGFSTPADAFALIEGMPTPVVAQCLAHAEQFRGRLYVPGVRNADPERARVAAERFQKVLLSTNDRVRSASDSGGAS